jgi:cell division septation protein DedD
MIFSRLTGLMSALLLLSSVCFIQPERAAAVESTYAQEILQYVREDKVYLLEKIRQKASRPSEKTIIEALLTEDGPRAAALYRKQLQQYPDPMLDPVSRAKLYDYENMLGMASSPAAPAAAPSTVPEPAPAPAPAPAPPPVSSPVPPSAPVAASGGESFTLQFGSFGSRENAEILARKISAYSPANVTQQNQMFKVRLLRKLASRPEASAYGKSIPFESIVVPAAP